MRFLSKIYNFLPYQIQNIGISIYGYYWKNRRLGKEFKKELFFYKKRENFTFQEWENYQETELRKLLIHAFKNVPLYNEKYIKAGFSLDDFKHFKLADLHKLPFLEKEELRKYGTTLLLSKKKEKGKFYYSSGSTGTPVSIYFSKKTHQKWFAAYESRVLNWAGVSIKNARGMIGGRKIIHKSNTKPPYFRFNKAEKQTYFSAYHIHEKSVKNYVKGIVKHKVEFMVGYAMSNYFLAKLIADKNIKVPKLKAVITSSEKLTNEMRTTFTKAYNCKAYDSYSGMEACGLISENLFGDFLFSPDTGVLELINEKGKEVDNGDEGEVVLTGLLNFDQPLIRYKIGDKATKKKNQQTKSGLEMPSILEINGRVEDVIIGKDGKQIVRFHSLFLNITGLIVGQIIQENLNVFVINLTVDNSYSQKSEFTILQRLNEILGENNTVDFKYLQEIPKNKNGKFRAVINNLKNV